MTAGTPRTRAFATCLGSTSMPASARVSETDVSTWVVCATSNCATEPLLASKRAFMAWISPSAFAEMACASLASLSEDVVSACSDSRAARKSLTAAPASALAALRRSDRAARASATTVEAFFSASMSSETPAELMVESVAKLRGAGSLGAASKFVVSQ